MPLTVDSPSLTADELAAFVEIETLVSANPLATFEPSPAFDAFFRDATRFILLRAANRVGKTYQGCARAAQEMIRTPGLRVRAVGPTSQQTQQVMGRYLAAFLGPYLAPGSYFTDGKGWNRSTIRLANGSICQLKSLEDNPQSHAGDEFDIVLLDEVPTRAIFTESLMRVSSRKGAVWVLMTPVDRPVEWFRDVVEADGSMWRQYVVAYSAQNCPWYDPDQVREHLEVLQASPWDYEQRALGAWDGVTTDRFYMGFTEKNVSATLPEGTWRVGLGIDHGEKAGREVALLVLYREVGQGSEKSLRVHVLDEYVSDRATYIEEDAAGILEMLTRHDLSAGNVDICVGDTNAGKAYAGAKINTALEDAFAMQTHRAVPPFRVLDATKHEGDYGYRVVNWMLARTEMTVHPRCVAFTKTLKHWQGKSTGDDGELKHLSDAFRYLALRITRGHTTYDRLRL